MKNKKSLGQHWLKNRAILEEIAELAASEVPICVEIGPGLGTLTSSLLRRFEKVVAVEYDEDLARKLPGSFPGKNLEVVNADILECDIDGVVTGVDKERGENRLKDGDREAKNDKNRGDFVVVGNIPYYITSPIIEKLLNLRVLPRKIVLLVQKEVAERAASEKETLLSLAVKNRAEVELGPVVPKEEFTPSPKVDSQVLILTPHAPEVGAEVMKLAKIGFTSPRKKLVHNLAGVAIRQWAEESPREEKLTHNVMGVAVERGAKDLLQKEKSVKKVFSSEEIKKALTEAGIDESARPGDLHLEDWARLAAILG